MNQEANQIINEIKKVIIGKDEVITKTLMAILSGGHILLEDVPGVGKTTLALAFSRAMGIDYRRIQFTSDMVPSDIVGFSVYDKASGELRYKPGSVMCNLLLADEINRTSSKTQSALLEVMEERQVTIDGVTHPVPDPFTVIATQNPVGTAGTQLLPQAQLDRFMIRMKICRPDFGSLVGILTDRRSVNPMDSVRAVIDGSGVKEMQHAVSLVDVQKSIAEYIAHLTEATHSHPSVLLGISPRGALAVMHMAQARAFISGRDYVVPEDVSDVLPDVCSHRLVLQAKSKMSHETPENVIREVLNSVPTPHTGG